MKLFELSTGNFKLVKEDGSLKTFSCVEEIYKELSLDNSLILLFSSEYLQIKDSKPQIFTTKIDGKYRVLYENGRVEMLEASKCSFVKFNGNYRKIHDWKSDDYMLLHNVIFNDGSEEIMTYKEYLTKSFVKRKDYLF